MSHKTKSSPNVTKSSAKPKADGNADKLEKDNENQPGPSEMYAILLALQDGQRRIIENQSKIKERLDSIENDVANLRDEVNIIRKEHDQNVEDIENLKTASDWRYDQVKNIQFEQVRQEQYSRKSLFRIFGVPEEDGEKVEELAIKVIKDEIDIILKNEDLDIVHRTGRYRDDGKPRPILVKCMSHKSKAKVMKNKKKAKNVRVHEDLAFGVKVVLDELIERKHELGLDSVWTIDGIIRFKFLRNERVYSISSYDDYVKLTSKHS